MLDQRLTTPFQLKWFPKLLGFDYEISYKKGCENIAADALSRVNSGMEIYDMALSSITSDLQQRVVESWKDDVDLQFLIQKLQQDPSLLPKYKWYNNLLTKKDKLVVGSDKS